MGKLSNSKVVVDSSGKGKLKVKSLDATNASLIASGSSQIAVDAGNVLEKLECTSSALSKVNFQGTTKNAELSADGLGEVTVLKVTGNLDRKPFGGGQISVANRPESSSSSTSTPAQKSVIVRNGTTYTLPKSNGAYDESEMVSSVSRMFGSAGDVSVGMVIPAGSVVVCGDDEGARAFAAMLNLDRFAKR